MTNKNIAIDPETYADIEDSVHEMLSADSISELSDIIMDRLNDFKDQAVPHETTYDAIARLAEAAIGLEFLRDFPVSEQGDYEKKQDAHMSYADRVAGSLSALLVHKDQTGIPEAKVVYNKMLEHGMNVIADQPESVPTETLDL